MKLVFIYFIKLLFTVTNHIVRNVLTDGVDFKVGINYDSLIFASVEEFNCLHSNFWLNSCGLTC